MLGRNRQREYLRNAWASMLKHYKVFLESGEPEELHKMRVQIKRIRALFELSHSNRTIKCIVRIQRLFSIAGTIRNAHITLQLAEKHRIASPNLVEEQKRVIERGMGKLLRSRKLRVKSISAARISVENSIRKVKGRRVSHLYKALIGEVEAVVKRAAFTEKHLHDCRKRVKTLLYVNEVLPKQMLDKIRINTVYLQSVQEAIGVWHDAQMVYQLLERYGETNVALGFKENVEKALRNALDLLCNFSERVYLS